MFASGDPHDDVGDLLDAGTELDGHAEGVQEDYPNVETPDWPGRDLDVITTTERAFLVHTDGPQGDNGPTQWLATDAGVVNLEDER